MWTICPHKVYHIVPGRSRRASHRGCMFVMSSSSAMTCSCSKTIQTVHPYQHCDSLLSHLHLSIITGSTQRAEIYLSAYGKIEALATASSESLVKATSVGSLEQYERFPRPYCSLDGRTV